MQAEGSDGKGWFLFLFWSFVAFCFLLARQTFSIHSEICLLCLKSLNPTPPQMCISYSEKPRNITEMKWGKVGVLGAAAQCH